MSRVRYFITGTDTDAGKTLASTALLQRFGEEGQTTLGLKPISAGCELTDQGLRNADALALSGASTLKVDYDTVNPIATQPPIAPHIALAQSSKRYSAAQLKGFIEGAIMVNRPDVTIIEGAGGWLVPLNERETLADVAATLNAKIILVIGMKLGCLNHALLTVQAIRQQGLQLAGWIASVVDPDMLVLDENLETLHHKIAAPCLGVIPYLSDPTPEKAAQYLKLP